MRTAKAVGLACVLAVVLATECGLAQDPPQATQTLPQATESALHTMLRQAGVIFAGRVIAVRRDSGIGIGIGVGNSGATGVVEIDFAVDDAIRGVGGGTYTLREWAGLWATGDAPFRVGQRFLMLLHAPGPAGLSSPVGGEDGAIPIRGSGQPAVAISTQTAGGVVDLRWIATRVVRPVLYEAPSVAHRIGRLVPMHPNAVVAGAAAGGESESPAAIPANPAAASAAPSDDIRTVLAMLRSWERDDHAPR
jgi:hypothetical protein